MRAFWIDNQGQVWRSDAAERRSLRDRRRPDVGESETPTGTPQGAVHVTRSRRGCRIRIRPADATDAALAALAYHLADDRPARVILSWYDGTWHDALFSEWSQVLARLFALAAGARGRDAFRHTPRPIGAVVRHPPLARLLARWHSLRRRFDRPSLEPLLRDDLGGRYIIVEARPDRPDLTVRAFGDGFVVYDDDWVRTAPGLRLQDQPDYAYGTWVAEAYRAALTADAPRLDDVDAVIAMPRVGAIRFRYRRLILPFRTARHAAWLVGASVIDPTLDLGTDARQAHAGVAPTARHGATRRPPDC